MDNRDNLKNTAPKKNNPNAYQLEKPKQSVTPVWASSSKNTPEPVVEVEKISKRNENIDYKQNPNAYGINSNIPAVKASWDNSMGDKKCPKCNELLRMDSVLLNFVCDKCGSFYDPKTLEKFKNDKTIAVSDELKAKRNSEEAGDIEDKNAGIQSPFKGINRLSADSVKCPGCSSNMTYNPDFKGLICKNCGGIYNANNLTIITESHNYDEGELTDINDNQNEITCNNCGSHIVADKNTSVTTCAFCGSPALIVGRLSRKFEPDYIIPFKINKEEAANKLIEWAKTNKNIPKAFYSKKNIEKITGIYVPFWLTDAECSVIVDGEGLKVSSSNSGGLYKLTREYDMHCRMIPFDGSVKWNDSLMQAIEPYDYNDMELYRESQAYLSGFMAERFDLPYYQMTDRIYKRITRYSVQKASRIRKGYSEYDKAHISNVAPFVDKMDFYYCLAPIWFINYDYRGEKYQFIVNGQTGKVAGEAPISVAQKRLYYVPRFTLFGLVAAVLAISGIGITVKALFAVFNYIKDLKWSFLLIALIFVALFAAIPFVCINVFSPWYKHIMEHKFQEEIVNLTPPADVYVRFEEKENVENKDDYYLATDGNINF
ncbi:MAG: zf-TFIIB domain-containing protein [Clostridia bacterium]|nr:zf-TFIIB domain-containing protein [Clostridia bacterium]